MALDAGSRAQRTAMANFSMAARAALVIIGRNPAQRRVRRVTRQAGQHAAALAEAGALAEIDRLVTRVPWVRPVRVFEGRGRFAVTASAELVQFSGGEPLGIFDRP